LNKMHKYTQCYFTLSHYDTLSSCVFAEAPPMRNVMDLLEMLRARGALVTDMGDDDDEHVVYSGDDIEDGDEENREARFEELADDDHEHGDALRIEEIAEDTTTGNSSIEEID
jgi:hypothetical protein